MIRQLQNSQLNDPQVFLNQDVKMFPFLVPTTVSQCFVVDPLCRCDLIDATMPVDCCPLPDATGGAWREMALRAGHI